MVSNHQKGSSYGTRCLQTLGLNSIWVRRFSSITHRVDGYSKLNTTWYRGSAPNHLAWTPLIDKTLTTISSGVNQEIIIGDSTLGLDCAYDILVEHTIVEDQFAKGRTQISSEHLGWDLLWIPDKIWLGRTSVALGDKLQVNPRPRTKRTDQLVRENVRAPIDTFVYPGL